MLDEVESRRGPVSRNRQRHWLAAIARLRPGVDAREARAELDLIAHTLNSTSAACDRSRGFHLERAGQIDPRLRRVALTVFSLLLGATMLVLLTACANVANLLLGRASARRREIAARMALGASRGRLLRQLLTESVVLALLGGVGGWIIAAYGTRMIGLLRVPLGWPLDLSISLDYRVLFFCMALSIGTGVFVGLVPALRATRPDLVTDLKADARGNAGARFGLRNSLVVAQVAICTVLHGVITFAVARRRREIGIRLAIGARPREILGMILKQGAAPAFVGTAAGVVVGLGVTRFAASLLYGVPPIDAMTFAAAPLLLMSVAVLACLLPARAAARVDPADVLRNE